jgi:hypothetical protein
MAGATAIKTKKQTASNVVTTFVVTTTTWERIVYIVVFMAARLPRRQRSWRSLDKLGMTLKLSGEADF